MPKRNKTRPSLRILGVMTGTSCDGLDVSCIEVDAEGWRPLWSAEAPYPQALRKRVLEAQKPGTRAGLREWLELDRDLGEWYGNAIKKLIVKNRPLPDLIANHGQTVAHFPAAKARGRTLQMGDPTRIAAATGISVASHFRDGDMSAGGQGAPLVPLFHQVLAGHLSSDGTGIAIHNVGGISNLTYVGQDTLLAFDTGPGNIWIDAATEASSSGKQKFDRGGRIARDGEVDEKAVREILRHPYFRKAPPKSTGRDDFPFRLLTSATRARGADLVATATAVTVDSIVFSYRRYILDQGLPLKAIHLCGGGAKNFSLIGGIQAALPDVEVRDLSQSGFNAQWVESQAFAFFGFLSLLGKPIGGTWTGAKSFGPPAHLIPGENWQALLAKLSQFT